MGLRKLQVFLSSTYNDLVDLRLSAIEAILAAGHIPATMEQFAPDDKTALQVIERWIAESDAFILMLGGRLGSLEPNSGRAYIELEYEMAIRLNKPYFAMVITDSGLQQRVTSRSFKEVLEQENTSEYKRFKARVTAKLCAFFGDSKDIRSTIFQKLPEWAQRDDVTGWVRATQGLSLERAEEPARENAGLQERTEDRFDGLTFEEMTTILRDSKVIHRWWFHGAHGDDPSKSGSETLSAGSVFDRYMDGLATGVSQELHSTFDRINHNRDEMLDVLVGHGLVTLSKGVFKLTNMGRRLRHRLLNKGNQEERARDIWRSSNT